MGGRRSVDDDLRRRAVDALTAPSYEHVVDLVAWAEDDDPDGRPDGPAAGDDPRSLRSTVVANSAGAVRLRPGEPDEVLHGRNPVADQDPLAFLPYAREVADPSPPNSRNAYPLPGPRLASLLADATRSPDLAVIHTPRHFFPEQHGHVGEHGSLGVVQSRAPLLLSGSGVEPRGPVDGWARLVDVGPTLAWLAGVPLDDDDRLLDAAGRRTDGRALTHLADRGPRWVLGVLWDGAPSGEVLHLATTGELPNVARLLERGLALTGGAVAEFPSVTLTNHTSILTGVGPGRHGVLGNVYYDRASRERVVPNDATTWQRSADWLRPRVRTVFEHVSAARPDATTACIDEAVDRGATSSTMQVVREQAGSAGADGLTALLPDPTGSPFLGDRAHLADAYFAWCTQVDDVGVQQVLQAWSDPATAPALTWWSNVVTDAGHHAGGPRSGIGRAGLRDADRRLGAVLDHLDLLGVADDVVVVLTSDHGFEESDPACRGDWDDALRAAGIPFRDEGPGFVYLGEEHARWTP